MPELAQSVKAELGMPVTLLDPFAGMGTAPSLAQAMPPRAARFTPLLGTLQAELRGTAHAIDFLNPRRRPPPVNRRKLWISLAAAAATLVVAYFVWGQIAHYYLAAEVDAKKHRYDELKTAVDNSKRRSARRSSRSRNGPIRKRFGSMSFTG